MLTFAKLLKILLPVASVTSATLITTSLVSFRKENDDKQKQNNDTLLVDFENPIKEFEERVLFYSKDGKGQGDVSLDKENAEKLKKHVENNQDLNKGLEKGGSVPDEVSEKVSGEERDPKIDQNETSALNNPPQIDGNSNQGSLTKNDFEKTGETLQNQAPKSEKVGGEVGNDASSSEQGPSSLKVESQSQGDHEGNSGDEETREPSSKIENNGNDDDRDLNTSENQDERDEVSSSEGLQSIDEKPKGNQSEQNSNDNLGESNEIDRASSPISSVELSSDEKHGRSEGIDSGLDSSGVNSINQERLKELQELEEKLQASRAQLENILSSSGIIR